MLHLIIKNLGRNKFQKGLVILSICVSVVILVSGFSIAKIVESSITEPFKIFYCGETMIMPGEMELVAKEGGIKDIKYMDDEGVYMLNKNRVREILPQEKIEELYSVLYVTGYSSGERVLLQSRDIEKDRAMSVEGMVEEGRYFTPEDNGKNRIVMDIIWKSRGLEVGDTFSVFVPSYRRKGERHIFDYSNGKTIDFELIGFFQMGVYYTDAIFAPEETLRKIMNIGENYATYFALPTETTVTGGSEYTVHTTTSLLELLNKDFRKFRDFSQKVAIIAYLICGISIISIMMFSISQRKRDIGILKAIGFTSRDIMKMFLTESIFIGIIGWIAGVFVGSIALHSIVSRAELHFTMEFSSIFENLFILVLIFGIASLYPAFKASKIAPMEVLRYG
ncbi:MAG: FtsX-like permease family protein [Euryarchaeota archaeon]|nr:FtsX-like permease family protein [Euryarchaeota archaeon]